MRVAINAWFWNQPITGSGQTVRYLVPALVDEHPDLSIVLVVPSWMAIARETLPPRVESYHVPCRAGDIGKLWFEQVAFPRACLRLGVDVAHVPYFASSLVPKVPTLVTIHDLIPMVLPQYKGSLPVRLYTSLVAAASRNVSLVLTDSQASKADVLRCLDLPSENVRVVYLSQAPYYRPVQDPVLLDTVRCKYNLPEKFVLWLSGFDVRKNATALLHAYTWVAHGTRDEYPLVMAGVLPDRDTRFFPDPRPMAADLGLSELVHYPGCIDEEDKPALYSAATAFVYPSRYEGFGLPILEAMACGTPVVTTNASSLPELAGTAAFQVAPDDTRGMGAAILSLCVDDELSTSLRQKGLEQAARFSWQKTAEETLAAYRWVLDHQRG